MMLGALLDSLKRLAKCYGEDADVWVKVDGVEASIRQIDVNEYTDETVSDVVLVGEA